MSEFVPGLELSRQFFEKVVKPIIRGHAPNLRYAAALIGSGSEVLGFDDQMSSDHHWGPRVMIFVNPVDLPSCEPLDTILREKLPVEFLGYPTNFTEPDPDDNNTRRLKSVTGPPVNHRVDFLSLGDYFLSYLGFDIGREIEPVDWLTFPEQKLRSVTAGTLFHDEIGMQRVLDRFEYYPRDVWLYVLASGWKRIGQEEHLMGRAGLAGDEIGSALIAGRLVRDVMRLCFLMEHTYAPYPKWFGTAFRQLKCAGEMQPHLSAILSSTTWQERERHLVPIYEKIAAMHNELKVTDPLPAKCADFFGRPFKVIELTGGFSKAIMARICDDEVRRIADQGLIGSIDQFSDSTDLVSNARWRPKLRDVYE